MDQNIQNTSNKINIFKKLVISVYQNYLVNGLLGDLEFCLYTLGSTVDR